MIAIVYLIVFLFGIVFGSFLNEYVIGFFAVSVPLLDIIYFRSEESLCLN